MMGYWVNFNFNLALLLTFSSVTASSKCHTTYDDSNLSKIFLPCNLPLLHHIQGPLPLRIKNTIECEHKKTLINKNKQEDYSFWKVSHKSTAVKRGQGHPSRFHQQFIDYLKIESSRGMLPRSRNNERRSKPSKNKMKGK